MNPLDHPICLSVPRRLSSDPAGNAHLPFALLLVDLVRPRSLVTLGAGEGVLSSALRQAVEELGTGTACEAFVSATTARLPQDIDLLDVEEAQDLSVGLPRLSASGLVVLPGISVPGSEASRQWTALSVRHPHFAFPDGAGLGLLAVGARMPQGVRAFVEASPDEAARLRTFFHALGARLSERAALTELQTVRKELGRRETVLQARTAQVAELETLAREQREEIQSIHGSMGWKIVRRYWQARERVLPPDSRRGALYQRGKRVLSALTRGLPRPSRPPAEAVAAPAPERAAASDVPWSQPLTQVSRASLGRRVLLIAELSLPQCKRYRVDQKAELLQSLGHEVTVLPWGDTAACRAALQLHGLVIFYRTPALPPVVGLIEEAKRLGLSLFFEVDDLVFDVEAYQANGNLKTLPPEESAQVLNGARLYREALRQCDRAIASTATLAECMRKVVGGDLHLLENGLDQRLLALAAELERRPPAVDPHTVTIGYGSGSRAHDADFLVAADALLEVMERYPQVRLALHGFLTPPPAFERFAERIFRIPFLRVEDYLRALASWQISLAPLEPTVFNDAKSNIKYLEASLFKVPTVASGARPFREVISQGQDGVIAHSRAEWVAALSRLVEDAQARRQMGEAAHRNVLARYHPDTLAARSLRPVLAELPTPSPDALKVLSVNLLFAPLSFGGATIVAEQLATRLQREACEVTIFTGIWKSELSAYDVVRYEAEGLPVIAVQVPHGGPRALDHENARMRELFAQALRAVRPDVVHFHSIQKLSASLASACDEEGIPYVITLHDAWWLCEKQFMVRDDGVYCGQKRIDLRVCSKCVPDPAFASERTYALRRVLDNAAHLLAPSAFQRDLYVANGVAPERISVNKNGVLRPARPRPARSTRGGPRIAYLGGRAVHKGYFWLQEILAGIPERDYTLVMTDIQLRLGSSSIHAAEWKVAGRVEIVPPYEQRGIDDFLGDIDVLVMPSLWKESFGMTVREALSRDIWVVTTEAGGVVEDIVEGVNGNVVPIGDTEGFRAALRALLRAPERLSGYRNPHREQVRDFDTQATELRGVLARAARTRRGPTETAPSASAPARPAAR
ncbi:glycosyltransferase [Archangium primigenium]|uniref:glycosyltransferase n=1 Tax=[Archangium] primigenium TaxID=2792470 RepID=UPI00195852C4|nr:glycosyltransferase [Archangium primigenium]